MHLTKSHKVDIRDYYVEHVVREVPKCACGCGMPAPFDRLLPGFRKYLKGHHRRGMTHSFAARVRIGSATRERWKARKLAGGTVQGVS